LRARLSAMFSWVPPHDQIAAGKNICSNNNDGNDNPNNKTK
jgi:hypothetical protein